MDSHSITSAIEAFCAATGYTPATVTQKAVRNSRLYRRLKNGGGCTLLTARRLLDWLEANAASDAATLTQVNEAHRKKSVNFAGAAE